MGNGRIVHPFEDQIQRKKRPFALERDSLHPTFINHFSIADLAGLMSVFALQTNIGAGHQ